LRTQHGIIKIGEVAAQSLSPSSCSALISSCFSVSLAGQQDRLKEQQTQTASDVLSLLRKRLERDIDALNFKITDSLEEISDDKQRLNEEKHAAAEEASKMKTQAEGMNCRFDRLAFLRSFVVFYVPFHGIFV
jgi:hypothetical protein